MCERGKIHTPNVPRLLFPASFTRVGAQTVVVDPTLLFPAPWTICGEALITHFLASSNSKGRVVTFVLLLLLFF